MYIVNSAYAAKGRGDRWDAHFEWRLCEQSEHPRAHFIHHVAGTLGEVTAGLVERAASHLRVLGQ
jgi:hypothetical protein